MFVKGRVTSGWYYGWVGRVELILGTVRPLEVERAQWFTPDNLEKYYANAAEVLVKAGIAVSNPDYDPNVEEGEMIFITKVSN